MAAAIHAVLPDIIIDPSRPWRWTAASAGAYVAEDDGGGGDPSTAPLQLNDLSITQLSEASFRSTVLRAAGSRGGGGADRDDAQAGACGGVGAPGRVRSLCVERAASVGARDLGLLEKDSSEPRRACARHVAEWTFRCGVRGSVVLVGITTLAAPRPGCAADQTALAFSRVRRVAAPSLCAPSLS